MKRFISGISTRTRWFVGIALFVVYIASAVWPFPFNQVCGLVLAIALGIFAFLCTIWLYDPDYDDTDDGSGHNGISLKWTHLLILMLTIITAYSAFGRQDDVSSSPATSEKYDIREVLDPYIDEIKEHLSADFSVVQVKCDELSQGQALIVAKVANDGISQSLYIVKNSSEPNNAEYRAFVENLQSYVEHTVSEINSSENVSVHFELQILDDIAYENYKEFGSDYPSTILEIYDGELRYDKMTDTSPESFAQTERMTKGKQQALRAALRYLDAMPFSYIGLIEQLEYEGYTHEEAVYGADHCGADWNAQAALKAESYLKLMAFSREGLIEQLEYEGFTHDQALFGVASVGY